MRTSMPRVMLLLAAALASSAPRVQAEDAPADWSVPSRPSEESKALSAFFSASRTWSGKIPAGVRGPDSPETISRGKAVCRELYGGFWYLCEMRETLEAAEASITWRGHMLVGFDPILNAYRAVLVDNRETMTLFEGELESSRFVLETPEPVLMMGQMMRQRLTWEKRDDGTLTFTDERQYGEDAGWRTFESGELQPPQ